MLNFQTKNQQLSTRILDSVLQSYSDLDYKQGQVLKKYLSVAKIMTAYIRQNIISEGQAQKKGILLLEGTVVVTKKIAKGKIIFSQVDSMQFLNLQVLMYERAHYTITVQSSQARYVQVSQVILAMIYGCMKNAIIEKEKARNKEVQSKLKEIEHKNQLRTKQKMVDQLSLPALKYFSKENKTQPSTSLNKKISHPSVQIQIKIGKQNSHRSLPKQKSYSLKAKTSKNIAFEPFQRPKKLDQQVTTDPSDRHERIFKQQLKTIIKRKLVYERKQLGVLKAYRHHHENNKVIYEEGNYFAEPQSSEIDQYFKF